jgi:integrase
MTGRRVTKYSGVYERVSEKKIFKGKPDIAFDITYRSEGKKIWEKIGWLSEGYSAKLAADVRAERIRTKRHGEELPHQKKKAITFKILAEKYLKWSKSNKNRAGIDDKSRYENHLKKRFDEKRLDEISPFDLERMKSDMAKAGLSPKTISHCLGLLRAMFNKASDWNLYQGPNPVKKVKMPVVQNARDRFLSFEEAAALLQELRRNPGNKNDCLELENPKLHDMGLLSLHTGARASEIFHLKGQDIDFRNGLITLRDTKNTETRYAPMTETVREMLKSRMLSDPNAYIFTDEQGQRVKRVSIAFKRVVDRLGLNDGIDDRRQRVVFHSLRHTFGSWLAIQGTPILTIARLMGHKSIAMAERYSHLSPDHKRQAALNLEKAFNESRNGATEMPVEG